RAVIVLQAGRKGNSFLPFAQFPVLPCRHGFRNRLNLCFRYKRQEPEGWIGSDTRTGRCRTDRPPIQGQERYGKKGNQEGKVEIARETRKNATSASGSADVAALRHRFRLVRQAPTTTFRRRRSAYAPASPRPTRPDTSVAGSGVLWGGGGG